METEHPRYETDRKLIPTCAPVSVGEDGWSEWLHPTAPSFFSECCDCGLVHEFEFEIVPRDEYNISLNPGERDDAVIIFRARRALTFVSDTPNVSGLSHPGVDRG